MDIRKFIAENMTRTKIVVFVVAVVLIAAAVIFALDPAKQLEKMRNDQRRANASLILDAIYQYSVDNNGFPVELPSSPKEICKSGSNCDGLVDIGVLTTGKKYLGSIPSDPKSTSPNGTGYQISKNSSGRITVSVIHPEGGTVIAVTR